MGKAHGMGKHGHMGTGRLQEEERKGRRKGVEEREAYWFYRGRKRGSYTGAGGYARHSSCRQQAHVAWVARDGSMGGIVGGKGMAWGVGQQGQRHGNGAGWCDRRIEKGKVTHGKMTRKKGRERKGKGGREKKRNLEIPKKFNKIL